jgi:hypothetical protein
LVLNGVDSLNKSRAVALIIALIVGALLLLPYFLGGFEWTAIETALLYGAGIVVLAVLLFVSPSPPAAKAKGRSGEGWDIKSITLLACHSCDSTGEREFQKGDFVGKVLGKCAKCKGEQYIRAIYAIDEKKTGKP